MEYKFDLESYIKYMEINLYCKTKKDLWMNEDFIQESKERYEKAGKYTRKLSNRDRDKIYLELKNKYEKFELDRYGNGIFYENEKQI